MKPLVIGGKTADDDSMSIGVPGLDGSVEVEVANPWADDFGQAARWWLTVDQAKQVRDHLDAVIKAYEEKS